MNLNETLLIALGILSGVLVYPKLTILNLIILIILFILGLGITHDYLISLSISLIITFIFAMLYNSNQVESFKNKIKKKKKITEDNIDDDNLDDNISNIFDSKMSFIENYKALTPNQVSGLNKDTQNLINTQKELIQTLKSMGPALKDGRAVLDTFKDYFGKDSDLEQLIK